MKGAQVVATDLRAGAAMVAAGLLASGKTTITNLINRFYDIEDGKIRYDGMNISKIKKALF